MYHILTGGYHANGFKTLMIVPRLCYIAIMKHVCQVFFVNMNICIFME